MEKRVMVFGAFDLIHDGHRFFLNEAKRYGYLTAVVARDSNIIKLKNNPPTYDEKKRKEDVKKLGIADKVILGSKDNFLATLKLYRPDILCIGYDQKFPSENTEKELNKILPDIKIIQIPPYNEKELKSSILKNKQKNKKD